MARIDALEWVSVLFARHNSVYKTLPCVDVWDKTRDARHYDGMDAVVAHPPCAQWGQLRHFANDVPEIKALAPWAVRCVRKCGGVLEHPRGSTLWGYEKLPMNGIDAFGGWTLPIDQNWFGHKARKRTLLYIVGCPPRDIPPLPLVLGRATHVVAGAPALDPVAALRRKQAPPEWSRPSVTHAEREHTPPELAAWLVELARRCKIPVATVKS